MNPDNMRPAGWFDRSLAFIIGIDQYRHFTPLSNAVRDAEDVASLLKNSLPNYSIEKLLVNATSDEINDLFDHGIPDAINDENVQVVIYYAGHGIAVDREEDDTRTGYIIPSDGTRENYGGFISMRTIYNKLRDLPVKPRHLLLVLDCCFAGSFKWTTSVSRSPGTEKDTIYRQRYNRFIAERAWQVLTSSSCNQRTIDSVYEHKLKDRSTSHVKNSPFVKYLKEGLSGAADLNSDGLLTITELQLFLREKIEKFTEKISGTSLQTPLLFPFNPAEHGRGEYLFLNPGCILNLPSYDPRKNPYMGLLAYTRESADLFYGRSQAISELKESCDNNRFTVVSGASGSGKSSLVMAGVLPQYNRDQVEIVQVGSDALKNLERAGALLRSKKRSVCYVDQLEEIYTQNRPETSMKCISMIYDMLKFVDGDIHLIVSVRSDMEHFFQKTELKEFWGAAGNSRYVVQHLRSNEIREIIERPAIQRLIEFNPSSLVDTIAGDIENEPGSLPLLSFFLKELYNELIIKNDFTEFTTADYLNAGTVTGSIRQKAEIFYTGLKSDEKQRIFRNLMIRMVAVDAGEYLKRKIFAHELAFPGLEESRLAKEMLEELAGSQNRLIVRGAVRDQTGYYEPAHDSIIRSWDKIVMWIQQKGTPKLLLFAEIRERAGVYFLSGFRRREVLMKEIEYKGLLEQFETDKSDFLNSAEIRFIDDSVSLRIKNQRIRTGTITTIISLLLITVTGLILYNQVTAYRAETNRILTLAQSQSEINPTHGVNLAQAVLGRDPQNVLAQRLVTNLMSDNDVAFYQKSITSPDTITAMEVSYNDQYIISTGYKTIHIWDTSGSLIRTISDTMGLKTNIRISPDNRYFLVLSNNGYYYDENTSDLEYLMAIRLYSIDGKLVYTNYTNNQTIGFIDVDRLVCGDKIVDTSGKVTGTYSSGTALAVSPGSDRLLAYSNDSVTLFTKMFRRKWVVNRKNLEHKVESSSLPLSPGTVKNAGFSSSLSNISYAAFSEADGCVVIATGNGFIFKVNAATGGIVNYFAPFNGTQYAYSSNGYGNLLCFPGYRNDYTRAAVYDTDGKLYRTLKAHTGLITGTSFFHHFNKVVTAGEDNKIIIWDLQKNFISKFNYSYDYFNNIGFEDGDTGLIHLTWQDRTALVQNHYSLQGTLRRTDTIAPDDSRIYCDRYGMSLYLYRNDSILHRLATGRYSPGDSAAGRVSFPMGMMPRLNMLLFYNTDSSKVYDKQLHLLSAIKNIQAEEPEVSSTGAFTLVKFRKNLYVTAFTVESMIDTFFIYSQSGKRAMVSEPGYEVPRDIILTDNNTVLFFYRSMIVESDLATAKRLREIKQDNTRITGAFKGTGSDYFTVEKSLLLLWNGGRLVNEFRGNEEKIANVTCSENKRYILCAYKPSNSATVWFSPAYYLASGFVSPLQQQEKKTYGIKD